MTAPHERRRSPRLTVEIPVRVLWRDPGGASHDIRAATAIVSRHGALLYLSLPLSLGAELRLTNPINNLSATARVVWTGDTLPDGTARVGIEFSSPVGYDFWGTMAVRLWEEHQQAARPGWLGRAWIRLRRAFR